jgi:1,4-alpha-glucan branching enzyme
MANQRGSVFFPGKGDEIMAPLGSLALVLHAHLPFIRHPEVSDFLEEDWFFEAVVETYAPLLRRFEKLREENIPFRLTMSVTPPLASMLDDDLLRARLADYLNKRIELLEKESAGNAGGHVRHIADHYLSEFHQCRDFIFNRHHGHLLNSFRSLYDTGHLEIITCTATHGFLPLMSEKSAWRNQVLTAVRTHEHFFGRRPRGIWLAECGYDDGVDEVLAEAGIEYTFVDSHGILFGDPQPVNGVYAPIITDNGVNVFARDPESSKQVWSQKEGYPGDAIYREFYRDLGYDADYDYIKPYLHSDGVRRGIGIKYHAITGNVDLSGKGYYDPVKAHEKVAEHAGNFMFNRQAQVRFLKNKTQSPPIIVAPYDAELYGHWWYEGPDFLDCFIRKMAFDQNEVGLTTCAEYLNNNPIRQLQKPNPSTWGSEGHNLVWLNGGNSWLYRHQHWAERKMRDLASHFQDATGDLRRALTQLQRELLLLQASDWAFILTTGTTVPYATRRFREHVAHFRTLADQIEGNRIDTSFLGELESRDGLFPTANIGDSKACCP